MQFDSSIGEFKVFASNTILRESLFARIMIEFIIVFLLGFFIVWRENFDLIKNI